jgi:hypothetical protein
MKMRLPQLSILFLCFFSGWIGFAYADVTGDWNLITAQASTTAAAPPTLRPPQAAPLDFAMVHIAMHDAVQAYQKRFEPYAADISDAEGSPIAAAAKAAHDVLVNRFPAQTSTLDDIYSDYLADNDLEENDPGVVIGELAAASIIALRANDGSYPPNPPQFVGGTDPGEWRPTPPAFAPGLVPWLGDVTPFALESTEQCAPEPPPDLTSNLYKKDYKEVKKFGSLESIARSDVRTDMANFWGQNIVQIWGLGLRDIATANIDDIGDSARLFALNYIANADAIICAWASKYYFVFWRPVTAIQEGDNDGNPQTEGDPDWVPFLPTPAYPSYTSGANNISGSTTRTLTNFFGTNHLNFSLTSTFQGVQRTRTYNKFSKVADEVVDVRVLQGIHFRFDDEAAREQGEDIADYLFQNFLRPIED